MQNLNTKSYLDKEEMHVHTKSDFYCMQSLDQSSMSTREHHHCICIHQQTTYLDDIINMWELIIITSVNIPLIHISPVTQCGQVMWSQKLVYLAVLEGKKSFLYLNEHEIHIHTIKTQENLNQSSA